MGGGGSNPLGPSTEKLRRLKKEALKEASSQDVQDGS